MVVVGIGGVVTEVVLWSENFVYQSWSELSELIGARSEISRYLGEKYFPLIKDEATDVKLFSWKYQISDQNAPKTRLFIKLNPRIDTTTQDLYCRGGLRCLKTSAPTTVSLLGTLGCWFFPDENAKNYRENRDHRKLESGFLTARDVSNQHHNIL
jgi:hypothetical protein